MPTRNVAFCTFKRAFDDNEAGATTTNPMIEIIHLKIALQSSALADNNLTAKWKVNSVRTACRRALRQMSDAI